MSNSVTGSLVMTPPRIWENRQGNVKETTPETATGNPVISRA
jgi:hypothetical protein